MDKYNKKLLRSQLKLNDLTIKEFCEKIGISEATFYRCEKKNGDFSFRQISSIASILGKDVAVNIFFGE